MLIRGFHKKLALAMHAIAGMLLLAFAVNVGARGQSGSNKSSNKEWCAMVARNCIAPGPGENVLDRCGIGQCRSPCPGERCKEKFDLAQKMHCKNLAVIGSPSADENAKQAAREADLKLKADWHNYNGAASCRLGGDIDCFYVYLDGLSDQCPSPPPPSSSNSTACDQEIQQLHDEHCQNVSNWWTATCRGDKERAQEVFNQDEDLKNVRYPDLFNQPECKAEAPLPGATPTPFDSRCFPPPEVCGAGTSRSSTSGGGGDGPPRKGGDEGGGGGGGGSGQGGGPPPSPKPQGPVHGTLAFLITGPFHPAKPGKPLAPVWKYPKGLAPVPVLQLRVWQALAASRDRLQHPLAAPDYSVSVPDETPVDLATINQTWLPHDADPVSRAGIDAVNAQWDEVGWLDSFAVHYDRYLGAKAARDQKATLALAKWMSTLIDRALDSRQDAAAKENNFERQVEKRLDELRASVGSSGSSWPVALKQTQDEIRKRGLPPEVGQELREAGVSDPEIKAFQQRLTAVTPKSIQDDIAALKPPDANARPQPLYLADLQAAQQVAHTARNEAEKAAKEAAAKISPSPVGGVQQSKKNSSRSLLLWVVVVLVLLAIVGFALGLRSARSSKAAGQQ